MNNKWSSNISRILGRFWDMVFKDYDFIASVKRSLGYVSDSIDKKYRTYKDSINIQTDSDKYDRLIPVSVPVDECIFNYCAITEYMPGDLIRKDSNLKSVGIPIKYVRDSVYIKDRLTSDSRVWLEGFNMVTQGDYVILYINESEDLEQYPEYINGKIVPVYRLYFTRTVHSNPKNKSFGTLMGINVSDIDDSHIRELWSVYVNGPSIASVNALAAYITGDSTCASDGYVADIWKECGRWFIQISDNKVYKGFTKPRVGIGDSVSIGDILFEGVTIIDADHIPDISDIKCLCIPSEYGLLYAVNEFLPAIPSPDGRYIPDMHNQKWAESVFKYLDDNKHIRLLEDSKCNPFVYLITNVCPGKLMMYTVKNDNCINSSMVDIINNIVVTGNPIPGISIINTECSSDTIQLSVSTNHPIASYIISTYTPNINVISGNVSTVVM